MHGQFVHVFPAWVRSTLGGCHPSPLLSGSLVVWMTKTSTMTRGRTRRRKGKRGGVSPPIPSSVGTKWDGERSVLRFTLFNRPWAVAEGREKRNPTGRSTDFIRPSHPKGWRGRERQRGGLSMGGRALVTWPFLPFPPSTRASTKSIWINIGASPPTLTYQRHPLHPTVGSWTHAIARNDGMQSNQPFWVMAFSSHPPSMLFFRDRSRPTTQHNG